MLTCETRRETNEPRAETRGDRDDVGQNKISDSFTHNLSLEKSGRCCGFYGFSIWHLRNLRENKKVLKEKRGYRVCES